MQHSVFKISNNEENVINPANLLSLWSTLLSSQGVDHKDRRLAELITFSSLLLILNNQLNFLFFNCMHSTFNMEDRAKKYTTL